MGGRRELLWASRGPYTHKGAHGFCYDFYTLQDSAESMAYWVDANLPGHEFTSSMYARPVLLMWRNKALKLHF